MRSSYYTPNALAFIRHLKKENEETFFFFCWRPKMKEELKMKKKKLFIFLFISSHWSTKRLLTSCQPSFGIALKRKLTIFNLKNLSRLKTDINKLGKAVETLGVIQHFSRKEIKEMKYLEF